MSAVTRVAFGLTWLLGATTALSPASCTSTANVSDVYLALDADGARKRNVFFTDSKEIHCIVEMGIGRQGVTMEVLFRQLKFYDFNLNKYFDTDRVLASAESSPQPADGIQKLDVQLLPSGPNGEQTPGAPYPPGRYRCEARLDGALEETAEFNVDFPGCPSATIQPLSKCFGFYQSPFECPKYGLTTTDPAKCRCSAAKGWECD
jgi:hypothetical protein